MLALLLLALTTTPVTVSRVVDGDTIHVDDGRDDITIRVLGIDCPEPHRNATCRKHGAAQCETEIPLGRAATKRARELLRPGDTVSIEGGEKVDRYGRTLAYVRLPDGRDYGLLMLREGICSDYSAKYPHPRQAEYRAAERR